MLYKDNTNLYTYTRNDPLNRIDLDGDRDIFVGGAKDKSTAIVGSYAKDFPRGADGKRDVHYVSGDRRDAVLALINSTPAGEPVNVVGHSWGAHAAAWATAHAKRRVTLLVTVDPVGRRKAGDPSGNSDTWINVTANPAKRDGSDTIASIGGKPPDLETSAADEQYTVNANHGSFSTMMAAQTKAGDTIRERVIGSTTIPSSKDTMPPPELLNPPDTSCQPNSRDSPCGQDRVD